MKTEIRYISEDGTVFDTPKEALAHDFHCRVKWRLETVLHEDYYSSYGISVHELAREIEAVMEALGVEFDREKFMSRKF